jgi:hypothetical protein
LEVNNLKNILATKEKEKTILHVELKKKRLWEGLQAQHKHMEEEHDK